MGLRTIILATLVVTTVYSQCPTLSGACRCAPSVYEPVAIICQNAGSLQNAIQAIQAARDIPIDSLTILDTAIPSIPANAFQSFTILRLVMNRNTLQSIDDQAFNGPLLDSLIELDFNDNNLGQVPQTAIPRLRNLRKLYLNRNRITQLSSTTFNSFESKDLLLKLELAGNRLTDGTLGDATVFRPLTLLQELSLETNSLTSIPSSALVNQRNTLTNLNLGLNSINDVPIGALDFPVLSSLSLEFNGITVIPPQAFQGVPNLQFLYMTGNKFPSWAPEMFRYIPQLKTLGIGETPISVIPNNAFTHIPNLIRLEMSEAAVDTIERGAFQRTPQIQAIVLNKNRLSQVRADFFEGLNALYSIDLQGNRIDNVQSLGFANLPSISHLDISYNLLQTMPSDVFQNSFLPQPNDRRVIYACGNPWYCNSELEWFRTLLRDNLDIDIEKPGCTAVCASSPNGCPVEGTPLRSVDFCQNNEEAQPLVGRALSMVGWIILAVIMTILLISICLLAMVRYGMSHQRKKQKDSEMAAEEFHAQTTATSIYNAPISAVDRPYSTVPPVNLDLPAAYTLDDRPNYLY
uniref:LRRCT domain-containing protein n=1 Tax=Caenorhabditis japonica TaxID=281687 RepID=A0A8R1HPA0_CAEJA